MMIFVQIFKVQIENGSHHPSPSISSTECLGYQNSSGKWVGLFIGIPGGDEGRLHPDWGKYIQYTSNRVLNIILKKNNHMFFLQT